MNKYVKIILIVVIVGIIIGGAGVIYVFFKPHRNLANEKPVFTLTAAELLKQFIANEDSTFKLYGDKALQLSGKIVDMNQKGSEITFVLEDQTIGVSCTFDSAYCVTNSAKIEKYKIGDDIEIKGKCDGYVMGAVITRCVLVEKE